MEILIGTKRLSTWSMRPWLCLKHIGAPFDETRIPLRTAATPDRIRAAGSPSGLVPVLKDGSITIWDSLAICEYLAERFPEARLWPADPAARALARAAASEMHSGFAALRGECPMDLGLVRTLDLSPAAGNDVRRICELWSVLLTRFGGPFLLGDDWSIADAFFTPVATRFRSYGVNLGDHGDAGGAGDYAAHLLQTPEFLVWEGEALVDMDMED